MYLKVLDYDCLCSGQKRGNYVPARRKMEEEKTTPQKKRQKTTATQSDMEWKTSKWPCFTSKRKAKKAMEKWTGFSLLLHWSDPHRLAPCSRLSAPRRTDTFSASFYYLSAGARSESRALADEAPRSTASNKNGWKVNCPRQVDVRVLFT